MKNLVLPCLLVICLGFQSCKNDEKRKEFDTAKAEGEKIVGTECYRAIYEKDTVDLKLNTLKNGKITGNLVMKAAAAPEKRGEITGEFRGDTLFADYTFINPGNATKFKNPLAILKKGEKLILGNGTMQTTMGVTYLVKDIPIDFENVKYKFDSAQCAEKK
ncbi:hypothetical protein [Flavobacterium sp. ACN6]|uniref:hypothetical protein n=1 Tax=Flavobacterium sp. ACN6 TaxID=1920426 RepID=UPI000BB3C0BE|nr:hypothetical protein [Flavobacterium sp. ACN6]PBJ12182.1 hypothetical protein BSF42_21370 [Flavobacterium sp. ACN6]